MKKKEDYIFERLRTIYEKYPVGSRVILQQDITDYPSLKRGMKGTVLYMDDMGTLHVFWDTNEKVGILLEENIVEICDIPSLNDIKNSFIFVWFIDYLRNKFLKNNLIITGPSELLSFKEIEKIMTLSLDLILNDKENQFSYIASYKNNDKLIDINIGIYNTLSQKEIDIVECSDSMFINNEETQELIEIIRKNRDLIIEELYNRKDEKNEQ